MQQIVSSWTRWMLGLSSAVAIVSWAPATASPPAASPVAAGTAQGKVAGQPFVAASVLAWKDPDSCWLSFRPTAPRTRGHLDPRARRGVENGFDIVLDTTRLKPGHWRLRAGHPFPADCPVLGCRLIEVTRKIQGNTSSAAVAVRCLSGGWSLDLTLDRCRHERGTLPGREAVWVAGQLQLIFTPGQAWLTGPFDARPVTRPSEAWH